MQCVTQVPHLGVTIARDLMKEVRKQNKTKDNISNKDTELTTMLIRDHLGTFGKFVDHLGSFGIIWEHLGTFGIIWDHLGPFGIIWDHLGPFRTN